MRTASQASAIPHPAAEPGAAQRPTALVIANRLPFPLDDGWKIRTYHMIRGLARVADVTLVTFHDGDHTVVDDLQAALALPLTVHTLPAPRVPMAVQVLRGLVSALPLHVCRQQSAPLRRLLQSLGRRHRFDVAVAEVTAMYRHLDVLPRGTLRILDAHNIDCAVMRRYATTLRGALRRGYAALTVRKYERYERAVFAAADLVWVCSEQDRRLLTGLAPDARVTVVPNGVDLERRDAPPAVAPHSRRLMFCGLMDYHPNVDAVQHFAARILPALKRAEPGIEFWVVGRSPAPEILALAEREPAVRVTGRVADVGALLATAAAVVVPLRAGGGTRLKILEALGMRKPVVATSIGMEGLELVAGRDLLVADSPEAFCDAVLRVLRDPACAARLGEQGRRTVAQRYDWSRIEEGLRRSLGWSACT